MPYAQFISLSVPDGGSGKASTLASAHRAISSVGSREVHAWLALGERVFSQEEKPLHLKMMPSFPGDLLDPKKSHGDLLVQITGTSATAVRDASDRVLNELSCEVIWCVEGSRPDNRSEGGVGLSRNPFHFTEGYGNPAAEDEIYRRAIVQDGSGEPQWAVGGSYQVVRIVRLAVEFWERDPVSEQERILGRRRDGQWLDGTPATDRADFSTDPHGKLTSLDSHVRRAAPDPGSPPPMVRRSYNYHRPPDDQGVIFSCFQRDLRKGFEEVQRRLRGEAMEKYTLTTGGGYFFVPPPGDAWVYALSRNQD
ncbi:Dyp-type peroxidase [Streptomyces sp. NPDC085460]|uniref:Dyp-type peroxidase n=1 Tax=Streptomyces sp. NPDC085460 TaxID=3365723 RepID=UPI0037D3A49C